MSGVNAVHFGSNSDNVVDMTVDPRAALDRFIAALEAHHSAVVTRRGEDEALALTHGELLPFSNIEDDDEDFDDDDDDDDEDYDED